MKATIESTSELVELDGVPTRLWRGTTDSGVPFLAYIHRVAVPLDAPPAFHAQFERELRTASAPQSVRGIQVFDRRLLS